MQQIDKHGPLWIHPLYQKPMRIVGGFLAFLLLIVYLTWLTPPQFDAGGVPGYLPLHTLFETFSIVVAMLVFAVGWNSQSHQLAGNVVLLSCTFFAIGLLDFSHTLAYKGMPDFYTPNDAEKQLNFWLSARFLASFILLVVAVRAWNPLRFRTTRYCLMGALTALVITINWLVLFHQDWLPHTFIPGQGLTPLKKFLEYLFIAFNIATAVLLWRKMREPQDFNITHMFAAVCVMAMSEFFFTLYTTMTGGYNVWGHIYKVISYLFIYRAIVVEAIELPYKKLEKTQSDLSLAIHASNTGLWDWDLKTDDIYYSAECKAQLGYAPNDFPNQRDAWETLIHPDDRVGSLKKLADFLNSTATQYLNEHRMRHKDGNYLWIEARGEKQFDRLGHAIRLVGSHVDISEHKRLEEHFRYAIDAAPNAMLMADENGTLVLGNSRTFEMFGYTQEELIGQSISILLPENSRAKHADFMKAWFSRPLRREMGSGLELFARHKLGFEIPVEIGLNPLQSNKGQFVIASVVDISERKMAMARLQEKNAEIERYSYMVSHDLKSPLVTIKAFLGYLKLDIANGDAERIEKDMAFMNQAANKMDQLLSELLEMSRIGRVTSLPVKINWREAVNEALTVNAGAIAKANVEITVDNNDIPLLVDRTRLVQVWQNLIDNAIKFMAEQPSKRIHIGAEKEGNKIVFFICDNGIGIDPRYHEKIFGMFEKLDTKKPGTGLGLALVKRIIQLYHGDIQVRSQGIGHGTCFRFTLPDALQFTNPGGGYERKAYQYPTR
ncbi:MAG: PAS domain S-box protein [Gammaproteobacteria bacterium]|nr:PAS domain S-box protein [Gammaproteobacteria bacterium]